METPQAAPGYQIPQYELQYDNNQQHQQQHQVQQLQPQQHQPHQHQPQQIQHQYDQSQIQHQTTQNQQPYTLPYNNFPVAQQQMMNQHQINPQNTHNLQNLQNPQLIPQNIQHPVSMQGVGGGGGGQVHDFVNQTNPMLMQQMQLFLNNLGGVNGFQGLGYNMNPVQNPAQNQHLNNHHVSNYATINETNSQEILDQPQKTQTDYQTYSNENSNDRHQPGTNTKEEKPTSKETVERHRLPNPPRVNKSPERQTFVKRSPTRGGTPNKNYKIRRESSYSSNYKKCFSYNHRPNINRRYSQRAPSTSLKNPPPRMQNNYQGRERHHEKQQSMYSRNEGRNEGRNQGQNEGRSEYGRANEKTGASGQGYYRGNRNREDYNRGERDYRPRDHEQEQWEHGQRGYRPRDQQSNEHQSNYRNNNQVIHENRQNNPEIREIQNFNTVTNARLSNKPMLNSQVSKDTGVATGASSNSADPSNTSRENKSDDNGSIRTKRISVASSVHQNLNGNNMHVQSNLQHFALQRQAAMRSSTQSLNQNCGVIPTNDSSPTTYNSRNNLNAQISSPVFGSCIPHSTGSSMNNLTGLPSSSASNGVQNIHSSNQPPSSDSPVQNSLNSTSSQQTSHNDMTPLFLPPKIPHTFPNQNRQNFQQQLPQNHQNMVNQHVTNSQFRQPVMNNQQQPPQQPQQQPPQQPQQQPLQQPQQQPPQQPQQQPQQQHNGLMNQAPRPLHADASYNFPSQLGASKFISPNQSRYMAQKSGFSAPKPISTGSNNFIRPNVPMEAIADRMNTTMDQSRNALYARDLEDDDVPAFVKADDQDHSKNSGNDDGDYETDEEYEISTRVDQEGNFRKTVVPSQAMMKRSLNNVSQILQESFQNPEKGGNHQGSIKEVMIQVSERPKEEKNLLLTLLTMMENASIDEKQQLLQMLGDSQIEQRIHQKYKRVPENRYRKKNRSGASSNGGRVKTKAGKRTVSRRLEFDKQRRMNSALPGDVVFSKEILNEQRSKSRDGKSFEPKSKETKSRENVISREAKSRQSLSRDAKSRDAKSRDAKSREVQTREVQSREVKSREAHSRNEAKSREQKSREQKLIVPNPKNQMCSTMMDALEVVSPKPKNKNDIPDLSFNTSNQSNTSRISATSTPRVGSGQKIRNPSKIPLRKTTSISSGNSLGLGETNFTIDSRSIQKMDSRSMQTRLDPNIEESTWNLNSQMIAEHKQPSQIPNQIPSIAKLSIDEKTAPNAGGTDENTSVDSKTSKEKKQSNKLKAMGSKAFKNIRQSVSRKKSSDKHLNDDNGGTPKISQSQRKLKNQTNSRSDSYEKAIHNAK